MDIVCSIIIPTFNTCEFTLCCLKSIAVYPPSSPYEVIVVDNASQDDTLRRVEQQYPAVIRIANKTNAGFSKACNRGARSARGQFLVFLNSDTELRANSLQLLMAWMTAHPKVGIVGPELLGPDNQLYQPSWFWHPLLGHELIRQYFAPYGIKRSPIRQHLIHRLQRRTRPVPAIGGACIMIRRSTFDQLGGFDERFELYFEDSDLCRRCEKLGWEIDYVEPSKVTHHLGQSVKTFWNLASLIYQQSHIAFYKKHSPAWAVYLLKLYLLLKWMRIRVAFVLTKGASKETRQFCRAYREMIFERKFFTLNEGF